MTKVRKKKANKTKWNEWWASQLSSAQLNSSQADFKVGVAELFLRLPPPLRSPCHDPSTHRSCQRYLYFILTDCPTDLSSRFKRNWKLAKRQQSPKKCSYANSQFETMHWPWGVLL